MSCKKWISTRWKSVSKRACETSYFCNSAKRRNLYIVLNDKDISSWFFNHKNVFSMSRRLLHFALDAVCLPEDDVIKWRFCTQGFQSNSGLFVAHRKIFNCVSKLFVGVQLMSLCTFFCFDIKIGRLIRDYFLHDVRNKWPLTYKRPFQEIHEGQSPVKYLPVSALCWHKRPKPCLRLLAAWSRSP